VNAHLLSVVGDSKTKKGEGTVRQCGLGLRAGKEEKKRQRRVGWCIAMKE